MSKSKRKLHFVHTVDTEGPISESLEDTFERLQLLFNINLEPSYETLSKLQKKEISLNGIEEDVSNCIKVLCTISKSGNIKNVPIA